MKNKGLQAFGWSLFLALLSGFSLLAQGLPPTIDGIAAIVSDKVITFSEVKKQVGPTEELLRTQYGGQQLVDKVKEARLNALKALIERQLILHDFEQKGYFLPEGLIEERVKEIISAQFDGDRTAFLKTLLANGVSLENYRKEIKEQLIIQSMRQVNVNEGVIVSPYKIEQYYQDNLRQFVEERQVKLRIFYLKRSLFLEERELSDGKVESYDPKAEMIQEILYKLDTGEDFEDLVHSYSEGAAQEQGGDLGWVTQEALREELRELAFSLKPGQHSRVVATHDGYYILKVEDLHREKLTPMNEVRAKIERTLIQEERQRLQQEWIDQLRAKAFIKMF